MYSRDLSCTAWYNLTTIRMMSRKTYDKDKLNLSKLYVHKKTPSPSALMWWRSGKMRKNVRF